MTIIFLVVAAQELVTLRIVRNAKREDLFFLIPTFLILVSALSVTAWDFVKLQESMYTPSPGSIVGLLLFIIGLVIQLVAWRTLRQSYSWTLEIKEGHRLIKHGIYKHTRHPIYLGTIMRIIAIPLFLSSLYGLLSMSALIPFIFYRIRVEERMLIEEYGNEYRKYMENTRKLIPFVY